MDGWREFDVAVGRWRLGEMPSESLPEAAVAAMAAGCNTPWLHRLAGMEGSTWSEIEPVVARVLTERQLTLPSEDEAVKAVADDVLRRVVAREIEPEAGTERLGRLAAGLGGFARRDLEVFVSLWFDWDSVHEGFVDGAAVAKEVLTEAQALLARGGVRVE